MKRVTYVALVVGYLIAVLTHLDWCENRQQARLSGKQTCSEFSHGAVSPLSVWPCKRKQRYNEREQQQWREQRCRHVQPGRGDFKTHIFLPDIWKMMRGVCTKSRHRESWRETERSERWWEQQSDNEIDCRALMGEGVLFAAPPDRTKAIIWVC